MSECWLGLCDCDVTWRGQCCSACMSRASAHRAPEVKVSDKTMIVRCHASHYPIMSGLRYFVLQKWCPWLSSVVYLFYLIIVLDLCVCCCLYFVFGGLPLCVWVWCLFHVGGFIFCPHTDFTTGAVLWPSCLLDLCSSVNFCDGAHSSSDTVCWMCCLELPFLWACMPACMICWYLGCRLWSCCVWTWDVRYPNHENDVFFLKWSQIRGSSWSLAHGDSDKALIFGALPWTLSKSPNHGRTYISLHLLD